MKSASYSELLKGNKDFRRLWAGQVISELGTWFSFIAELGLVRMLSGSPLMTTALLVARLLPFLLVAPIAGVFADRRSRKQIMIAADLMRAVIAVAYVFAGLIGSAWMVVVCSALMASLTMFFEAAKNATIPNLVTPRELLTANVLMFSTRFLQYTLGSAIGGLTAAQTATHEQVVAWAGGDQPCRRHIGEGDAARERVEAGDRTARRADVCGSCGNHADCRERAAA